MRQKKSYPILLTIIILIIGTTGVIITINKSNSQLISINNPSISEVTTDSNNLNLQSIVHEAEKNVIQIEGKNESNTITGSGFLYNNKGDIITNAHVINEADVLNVRTANARVYPAAVVGISEKTDIAVIRVPQLASEQSLPIEKEEVAEIGDEVIALGSPHGFHNTVTLGIISGKDRNFSVDGFDYNNVYQISAPITHGNSGGPLIKRDTGEIIGINSVGTEDGLIGFSIPIAEVINQIEQWSNEVKNDDLQFASTSDIISIQKPDLVLEDAEYVVNYFLESITMRDYVSAYALLGSPLQLETSYADFRDNYINIINLKYDDLKSNTNKNNIEVALSITAERKLQKDHDTKIETFPVTFEIGFENDQLKILKITKSD
ncbi:S1C family serine protease [Oceanobacillus halophilus]|uniref:Serine protease n=1 Tax=Oceanobacillus halophilus TaxID=930130 RepID=A0A495ABD0_9BACI|nr:trypsin-like peptidase domain-containing protein [Oceanobacillus halophilus]RKQ37326.1 serine protease [Oceanobacillus halophilus]